MLYGDFGEAECGCAGHGAEPGRVVWSSLVALRQSFLVTVLFQSAADGRCVLSVVSLATDTSTTTSEPGKPPVKTIGATLCGRFPLQAIITEGMSSALAPATPAAALPTARFTPLSAGIHVGSGAVASTLSVLWQPVLSAASSGAPKDTRCVLQTYAFPVSPMWFNFAPVAVPGAGQVLRYSAAPDCPLPSVLCVQPSLVLVAVPVSATSVSVTAWSLLYGVMVGSCKLTDFLAKGVSLAAPASAAEATPSKTPSKKARKGSDAAAGSSAVPAVKQLQIDVSEDASWLSVFVSGVVGVSCVALPFVAFGTDLCNSLNHSKQSRPFLVGVPRASAASALALKDSHPYGDVDWRTAILYRQSKDEEAMSRFQKRGGNSVKKLLSAARGMSQPNRNPSQRLVKAVTNLMVRRMKVNASEVRTEFGALLRSRRVSSAACPSLVPSLLKLGDLELLEACVSSVGDIAEKSLVRTVDVQFSRGGAATAFHRVSCAVLSSLFSGPHST